MGDCVSSLKEYRHDLAAHLADGLDATAPPLGKTVNPPAVVVQPGTPYVTGPDYCTDAILFDATVIAPPGDLPAVADALDDMIDLVRSTLKTVSPAGHRYGFMEVSGPTSYVIDDTVSFPAVVVTVRIERAP